MKSYEDLDIYKLAFTLAKKVHGLSLSLPAYELYEQGSQLRRSSKRIKDTIAEGYGRRRYKDEFIRFLVFAHASTDETISQLKMIHDLYRLEQTPSLIREYKVLGRKIYRFLEFVEKDWQSSK